MTLFEELKARGIIAQTSGDEEIADLVNGGRAVFYIGFDPSADSLTVGHFVPLTLMKRLQQTGNRPIVLVGGGTMMVGDPSGRTDMRSMMDSAQIAANVGRFRGQIGKFIDFSEDKALFVNNADWLLPLNYMEFLREVGVHFSVNRMLTAECYKNRLEKGLTFLEFNYMLMQSYDYLHLHRLHGCNLQCGGDDQWSNILSGADLVRRKTGHTAHAMTMALLLTHDGKKMGKTAQGAIWLDQARTSPYDFYQFFRNTHDNDVIPVMKRLTFLPLEQIDEYKGLSGSALNEAKGRLAFEMTAMVHGREEAEKAQEAARSLFEGSGLSADMPSTAIAPEQLTEGALRVVDALVVTGIAKSKGEARRLVEQGGVEVNGQRVGGIDATLEPPWPQDGFVLRKGKKVYHRITVK